MLPRTTSWQRAQNATTTIKKIRRRKYKEIKKIQRNYTNLTDEPRRKEEAQGRRHKTTKLMLKL